MVRQAGRRDLDLARPARGKHLARQRPDPSGDGLIRDRRFWPFVARLGLVDYWLDSNQWPDFCAEPDLPFDCKEQARKARSAGKPR